MTRRSWPWDWRDALIVWATVVLTVAWGAAYLRLG